MKKIRKILFLTFGLLMICLTLALVSHNVIIKDDSFSEGSKVSTTVTPDPIKIDGYGAGLLVEFTEDSNFEFSGSVDYIEDLSEVSTFTESGNTNIHYI